MTKRWVDRTRPLRRVGNRIEVFEQRHLGTSFMSLINPGSVLVVETTGRRTGRRRRAPVAYWRDDAGAFLVGGGAAGMTIDPDWVRNLRAHPDAAVWVRRRRMPVVAHELTGDARDEAHRYAVTVWRGVPSYERRSGRPVPYFRLVPSSDVVIRAFRAADAPVWQGLFESVAAEGRWIGAEADLGDPPMGPPRHGTPNWGTSPGLSPGVVPQNGVTASSTVPTWR